MINSAFVSVETFTSEEFEHLIRELPPSDPNTYELINGRIVMTPSPGWPHGIYESRFVTALTNYVSSRNLGLVFGSSQGFRLSGEDTVAPDVAYVSHERWAAGPAPIMGKHLRVTLNLVVEILSPTTVKRDREEKKELYARCGVEEYWVFDPSEPSVTVFHLEQGEYVEVASARETGRVESRLLPGFSLALEDIVASG